MCINKSHWFSLLLCVCRFWAGHLSSYQLWWDFWLPVAQTVVPRSATCSSRSGSATWRGRKSALTPFQWNMPTSWRRGTCKASLRIKMLLPSHSPTTSHGRRYQPTTAFPRVSSTTARCSGTWRRQTESSNQKNALSWILTTG